MSDQSPFFTPATSPAPVQPSVSDTSELEALRAQVAALIAQVNAPAAPKVDPNSVVRENGAGIGMETAGTWSQYDQELADAGVHPLQVSQPAPWLG